MANAGSFNIMIQCLPGSESPTEGHGIQTERLRCAKNYVGGSVVESGEQGAK